MENPNEVLLTKGTLTMELIKNFICFLDRFCILFSWSTNLYI